MQMNPPGGKGCTHIVDDLGKYAGLCNEDLYTTNITGLRNHIAQTAHQVGLTTQVEQSTFSEGLMVHLSQAVSGPRAEPMSTSSKWTDPRYGRMSGSTLQSQPAGAEGTSLRRTGHMHGIWPMTRGLTSCNSPRHSLSGAGAIWHPAPGARSENESVIFSIRRTDSLSDKVSKCQNTNTGPFRILWPFTLPAGPSSMAVHSKFHAPSTQGRAHH